MSDKLTEIEARESAALAALLDYEQADHDGVMVLASRQAIHEVIDGYARLRDLLSPQR